MNYSFSCKDCVFENDLNCDLDRIEKYKSDGFKVDVHDGHNFINGLMGCSAKRTDIWDAYNTSKTEQITKVMDEHTIKYDIVLYLSTKNTEGWIQRSYLSRIKSRIKEIRDLKLKPTKVIVAFTDKYNLDVQEIAKLFEQESIQYGISIHKNAATDGDLIDLAYELTESPYMLVQPHDIPLLNDTAHKFDLYLKKWNRLILTHEEHFREEFFVSTVLFETVKGCDSLDQNTPNDIERFFDKVNVLTVDQNKQKLVCTFEELNQYVEGIY